jgi:hypothetical protein
MKCSSCGFENPDLAKFCNHCGVKMEQHGKTCTNTECKSSGLPPEAVYCPDCGTALSQNCNSETISSILSGLENNRKTKTQQVNYPIEETNKVERKSIDVSENITRVALSPTGNKILNMLEGFANIVGFILGAIPVILLIFVLFRGCS